MSSALIDPPVNTSTPVKVRVQRKTLPIESGIPIPDRTYNGANRIPIYPFATMNVGQSFSVPFHPKAYARVQSAKYVFTQRPGFRNRNYIVRHVQTGLENVIRTWRTEDTVDVAP